MKLAITGKGGVGKTTIAAAIVLILAKRGQRVLAVDADPDANLASALGIPYSKHARIRTIAQEKKLIEERTGSGNSGMFKLNPEVSDIAEKFAFHHEGVDLVVLGAVRAGGAGCACPENAFLRALVQDLVLRRNESLVLDMEAGIEHLGRATARGVDAFIAVAEPGQRSVATIRRIAQMAREIGIEKTYVVINGIKNSMDADFLNRELCGFEIIAQIPYHDAIRESDRDGCSVIGELPSEIRACFDKLVDCLLTKFS